METSIDHFIPFRRSRLVASASARARAIRRLETNRYFHVKTEESIYSRLIHICLTLTDCLREEGKEGRSDEFDMETNCSQEIDASLIER